MVGENSNSVHDDHDAVGVLKARTPDAAARDDADLLVRMGRANIARLSLELRVAVREAEAAERAVAAPGHTADGMHLLAIDHLRAALETRLAMRRSELAAEVEQARAEATRCVVAAQAVAEALIAAATDELQQTASVKTEAAGFVAGALEERHEATLAGAGRRCSAPLHHRIVAEPVPPLEPALAALVDYDDQLDVAEDTAPDSAGDHWPSLPDPAAQRPPLSAAPAPTLPTLPEPMRPPTPGALPAEPPQLRTSRPGRARSPHVRSPQVRWKRRRAPRARPAQVSPRSRLLHADVLLPLIAGVVVLVALLVGLS